MTSVNGSEEVLKQDTRGRIRVSRERRESVLAEFERSGLTGAKFARLAGINYQTFAGWVRRRKLSRAEAGGSLSQPILTGGGTVRLFEAVLGPDDPLSLECHEVVLYIQLQNPTLVLCLFAMAKILDA